MASSANQSRYFVCEEICLPIDDVCFRAEGFVESSVGFDSSDLDRAVITDLICEGAAYELSERERQLIQEMVHEAAETQVDDWREDRERTFSAIALFDRFAGQFAACRAGERSVA